MTVIAELWPTVDRYVDGSTPAQVLAYYEELGFTICLLQPDGSLDETTPADLLARHTGIPIMNIVLRKTGGCAAARAPHRQLDPIPELEDTR